MKKKIAAVLIPLVLIILIIVVAVTHRAKARLTDDGISVTNSGFYFDTVITITLYGTSDDDLIDACFERCAEYESLLSRTAQGSDVWNINHAKGEKTEVDERTAFLIQKALSFCDLTDGRFDISIAAASSLWDFDSPDKQLPDAALLENAVSHVDYHKIKVEQSDQDNKKDALWYVTLEDPDMMIDLGGIAKGYIADELKTYLTDRGVEHAIINLGGNVLVIGSKPDGAPYRVGIQYPFKEEGELIAAASLDDTSLVTSGGYERYIEKDDAIYHHILDPETGYAVDSDILSVTICCPSSLQADALSTSVFLLGSKKGVDLINHMDDTSALIITEDMKQHSVGDFPLTDLQ